jgi:hypothetical protein
MLKLSYSWMTLTYYLLNNFKSLNEKIQTAMNQTENWFAENHLIINTEKTKVLFFQGRSPRPIHKLDLFLNSKEITYASNLKFLKFKLGSYSTPNSKT